MGWTARARAPAMPDNGEDSDEPGTLIQRRPPAYRRSHGGAPGSTVQPRASLTANDHRRTRSLTTGLVRAAERDLHVSAPPLRPLRIRCPRIPERSWSTRKRTGE
jgi:hypothetical protein